MIYRYGVNLQLTSFYPEFLPFSVHCYVNQTKDKLSRTDKESIYTQRWYGYHYCRFQIILEKSFSGYVTSGAGVSGFSIRRGDLGEGNL